MKRIFDLPCFRHSLTEIEREMPHETARR